MIITEDKRIIRNRKAREWRLQHPEEVRERQARWRKKNPDRAKKNSAAWRLQHPSHGKEYNESHPEKRRESRWRCRGVDTSCWNNEQYLLTFERQGGKCLGCGIDLVKNGSEIDASHRMAHVDHNHVTGKVRGLLCGNCNKAVGLLNDNLSTICRLIIYLKSNQ